MKITCECGKVLHADECAFHNDNYADFVIYFCPYCGATIRSFWPSSIEEIASMPKKMRVPEKLLKRRLEKKDEKLQKKMAEMNDRAIAGIKWLEDMSQNPEKEED